MYTGQVDQIYAKSSSMHKVENRNELSAEVLLQCFECDFESGVVRWRARPASHFGSTRAAAIFNARFAGKIAGHSDTHGYRRIAIVICGQRKNYLAHRIVWAMALGRWPDRFLDHIDGNPANSSLSNLREADDTENARNSATRSSKLGIKGVRERKGRFHAHIGLSGKTVYLGSFATLDEATSAYSEASRRHFGGFARA